MLFESHNSLLSSEHSMFAYGGCGVCAIRFSSGGCEEIVFLSSGAISFVCEKHVN